MKLKNKYSKQNIYSNQKFGTKFDIISKKYDISNFFTTSRKCFPEKVFSAQIFQENTFLEIKLNFPLTGKCFLLINFSNDK